MDAPREPARTTLSALETRRPLLLRRLLIAYALAVLLIGWIFGIWQVRNDREATLAAARNELTTLATALGTQFGSMINDGVGAAVAAANEVNAENARLASSETEMAATLGRMLTGGDYVREVFIVTPSKFASAARGVRAASPEAPPAWTADLFGAGTGDIFVGSPLNPGRADEEAVLPVARRVASATREPQWAGAYFGFKSLLQVYGNLPLRGGTVALVSTDGTLIMRAPLTPGESYVGRSFAETEAFALGRDNVGVLEHFEAPAPLTGTPRLFAVVRLENYPIAAVAAVDVQAALLPWRARTAASLRSGGLMTLAWIVLTLALYSVLRRHYDILRRSERRFQLAASAATDGIWDWDAATNRVYYSPRLKEHLGHAGDSAFPPVPGTFWDRVHPDDLAVVQDALRRHLKDRVPYEIEYRARLASGEYRWFKARAQAIWDESGKPIRMAGSIGDINKRKLAERSLQQAQARELAAREEFAQHLLTAQEQERQRLANELHDGVGQNLSLIKNRAMLALQQPDLPQTARGHVSALVELAADTIAEVRAVAHNLRPLHIEQLGLTDALDALLGKADESSHLTIARRLENVDDALSATAATHLYRIAQEALNNTLRHAQATRAEVRLERDVNCVRLHLADNGRGFDPDAEASKHGLGLASIAERTRMLNGTCRIDVGEGKGTAIIIEVPIADPDAAASAVTHDPGSKPRSARSVGNS